jgi:hypothetical protein
MSYILYTESTSYLVSHTESTAISSDLSVTFKYFPTAAESALASSHADLAALRNAGKADMEKALADKVTYPLTFFLLFLSPIKHSSSTISKSSEVKVWLHDLADFVWLLK